MNVSCLAGSCGLAQDAGRVLRAGALAGLLACVWPAGAAETVRIAGSSGLGDVPTTVADGLGLFEGDGPPIRVEYASSGAAALARLLRGEVEFALAAPTPVARALLEMGAPGDDDPVVLASVSLSTRLHQVVATAARGIRVPADLVGRRVGIMLGTSAHFGWSRFASFHGIPEAAVTLVDVPVTRQAEALGAGEVDAVMTWEPYASRIRAELGADAVAFSTHRLYSVDWLLLCRRGLLRARPELVARVLSAYLEAVPILRRDPAAARDLYIRRRGAVPAELASFEHEVIWRVALDWAVVARLETRLGWLRARAGAPVAAPDVRDYLAAAPLHELSPDSVRLPRSLLQGSQAGQRSP